MWLTKAYTSQEAHASTSVSSSRFEPVKFYKDEKWHKKEEPDFICNDEEMFELILFEILGKSSSENNIFKKVMDDYVDTLSKVELDLNKQNDIIAPV